MQKWVMTFTVGHLINDDQNMDQRDYQDDLPEDQDYYDQSNEDEEQPLDGSMESLEQFV